MKITVTDRSLPYAALFLWCLSLFLPAFLIEGPSDFSGLNTLLMGLLFGWMYDGWAAYANLFLLYVIVSLILRRTPWVATLLMLMLIASLPFVEGIPKDEGTDVVLEIISWGIGFFIWLTAILLVAIAVILRSLKVSPSKGVAVCSSLIALLYLFLLINYLSVRALANDQEREIFLSDGMIFPRVEMSGVKFSFPAESLVTNDQIVTIKIDPELNEPTGNTPYIKLPYIANYQQGTYKWVSKPLLDRGSIVVRTPADPETIVLEVIKDQGNILIRVLDMNLQKDIYSQQLKVMQRKGYQYLYPYAAQPNISLGWDSALLKVLGRDQFFEERKAEKLESADVAGVLCSIKQSDEEEISIWDGRSVLFGSSGLKYDISMCSKKYIYLVKLNWVESKRALPYVRIFDRQTMNHIASFGIKNKDLGVGQENIIKRIQLQGHQLIVETFQSEKITVPRLY